MSDYDKKPGKVKDWFDTPSRGVYVAKNLDAFNHIRGIRKRLKTFKVAEGLDCSSITSARSMFSECEVLESVDTSAFGNVVKAWRMFGFCEGLEAIDASVFTKVEDSDEMFVDCKGLKTYVPSGNPEIDSQLEELGAKPTKAIYESIGRRVWMESIDDMLYLS